MFKDFESFGIKVKDDDGNVDARFMERFIKEMVSQAGTDVVTENNIFFKYEFKNSPARVGIMLSKEKENLQYEDCTTYLETIETINATLIERISNEKVLIQIGNLKVEVYMNLKDRNIGDEVQINLSIFPVKLEMYNDENEYLNQGLEKNVDGKVNLFNLKVGSVSPIMRLLRKDYSAMSELVNDENFDCYDDAFSVVVGKITYAQTVNNIMEINNKDVELSQFDYYSINTQYGEIATAIPNVLYYDATENKQIELSEESVFKLYGYLVANIIEEF